MADNDRLAPPPIYAEAPVAVVVEDVPAPASAPVPVPTLPVENIPVSTQPVLEKEKKTVLYKNPMAYRYVFIVVALLVILFSMKKKR